MSEEEYPGPLHDQTTARSHFRYFFYDKHHTPRNTDDAQWSESLSKADEFAIFNRADVDEVVAANGDFFGIWKTATGQIRVLGTKREEIAEFPATRHPRAWHGYPLWPLKKAGRNVRHRLPVPRVALDLMVRCGWISEAQRRRLVKGDNIS